MVYYFTSTGKDATGMLDSVDPYKCENKKGQRINRKFLSFLNHERTFLF